MASLGLVMVVMGVRRELGDAVDRTDFAIEAALLIVTAVSAAVGALLVSIPGAERARLVRLLPLVAGSATVLWAFGTADRLGHWGSNRALNVCLAPCTRRQALRQSERRVVGDDQARRMYGARAGYRHSRRPPSGWGEHHLPNDRPLHAAVARHAVDAVCWPRASRRGYSAGASEASFCPFRGARRQDHGMAVNRWNPALDGVFTNALRGKLEAQRDIAWLATSTPPVSLPDHKHGIDKIDAVVAGRFRLIIGGHVVVLRAGEWVSVPAGVVHSAAVVGDEPVISLDAIKVDPFGSVA